MVSDNLTTPRQRVVLGDKEFYLSPLTLGAQEKLGFLFQEHNSTYDQAMIEISNGSVKHCLLLVYGLIEDSKLFKGFEEFKELANKHLNISELKVILDNVFISAAPDFSFDDEEKKSRINWLGLMILILAIIGMIHSLTWLYESLSPYLSTLI